VGESQIRTMAANMAHEAGLDGALLFAVIKTESGWNPRAFRHEPAFYTRYIADNPDLNALWGGAPRRISSSYGLGQLMYTTALENGFSRNRPPEDLYDPKTNLELTIRLLTRLLRKYGGNVKDAVAAYNSGRPFDKAPRFTRETHVPKVLRAMGGTATTLAKKATTALPSWTWLALAGISGLLIVALAARGGQQGV